MPTVASLAVEVTSDTKDAQSGLSGILQTMLGFVGGQAVIGAVTTAFGFLKGQIMDVASATNEQDAAAAQLNSVLKSTKDISGLTYGSLTKLAEGISSVTDYSKPMIEQSEKVLLTFTNIGKNVFPQAEQAAVDLASRMGIDLASASMLVGKALNDPVKGMAALRREGVDLSVTQQDQVKHFMAIGDVADAQKIILGELNKEMGGAGVAAASTFGGQVQLLQNKLQDLYATFGDDVEPILGKFIGQVLPLVQNIGQAVAQIFDLGGAFKAMSDPTQIAANAASLVSQGLANILAVVKQVSVGIEDGTGKFGGLRDALVAVAAFLFQQVIPAMQQLATFATSDLLPALASVGGFLASTVLPILGTLANVFITDVLPAAEKVAHALLTELLPPLEKILSQVLPVLNPILQIMGWILGNVIGPALELVILGISKLLELISSSITIVESFVNQGLAGIRVELTNDSTIIKAVVNDFKDMLDVIGKVVNVLGGLKNAVGSALSGAGGGLGGLLQNIPHFATGGVVTSPTIAYIGEDEPEIVVPLSQLTGGSGSGASGGAPAGMSLMPGLAASGSVNGQPVQVSLYLNNQMVGMAILPVLTPLIRNALGTRSI
jgi:hypothetical protein